MNARLRRFGLPGTVPPKIGRPGPKVSPGPAAVLAVIFFLIGRVFLLGGLAEIIR